MGYFVIEQWICNMCDDEFFTYSDGKEPVACPKCGEREPNIDQGVSFKATRWNGEKLDGEV